jgi:hypothetical protein
MYLKMHEYGKGPVSEAVGYLFSDTDHAGRDRQTNPILIKRRRGCATARM